MVITHHGLHFFKITQGDTVITVNPIGNAKTSKFGADIALASTAHPSMAGFETVTYNGKAPFQIKGPGEYEVQGLVFEGAGVPVLLDGATYINTVYTCTIDGMRTVFLGALQSRDISPQLRAVIGSPEILFIAIGNEYLSPQDAAKLAVAVDANIIIPTAADEASLKQFLKEASQENAETVEKLTLKKRDIDGKEGIVYLITG